MRRFNSCFFIWISASIWLLFIVYLWSIQSVLTCSRLQNNCQLSTRELTGLRAENFSVQSLQRAEVIGGGESLPMVILKTFQGDKPMTTDSRAEDAAFKVNKFIFNPEQKLLQIEQSNSWEPFDLLLWISLPILIVIAPLSRFLNGLRDILFLTLSLILSHNKPKNDQNIKN